MKNQLNCNSGVSIKPEVFPFFDKETSTFSYVVKDPESNACAVIDPVANINYSSGNISFDGADKIIDCVKTQGLSVKWVIETHVHADHLSAAPYIQEHLGGKLGIGSNITVVQKVFANIFNASSDFQCDGSQFDCLFDDEDTYQIGGMTAYALHTPGHTPACMAHVIGDAVFVGDTLFMPDGGTARADFPGGDARTLFQSIQKILSLPSETRLFMCHDYPPGEREPECTTTIGKEREKNIHVHDGISENDFVAARKARDTTLSVPKLLLPSLQVNMRGGHLPPAEDNNKVYLKVPVNTFK